MKLEVGASGRLGLLLLALFSSLMLDPAVSSAATQSTTQSCAQSKPHNSNTGFPEVRGVATHGAKLWALLFYQPPAAVGTDLKIVVDMTSSGPFHISAIGPRGQTARPVWIEPHDGSNWNRPGDEWGTGWNLPTPGCWHLHVTRRHASGNIWLQVVQPSS